MNLALSPARLKAVALILVLLLTSQTSVFGFQRTKTAKKKPQTSADADFDPAKVTKLAVVVVGSTQNLWASRIRSQTDLSSDWSKTRSSRS